MKYHPDKETPALEKRFLNISGESMPTVHTLWTNYRSVQEIVNLANEVRGDATAAQVAARGLLGIKPMMIRIVGKPTSESSMIQIMVDAALHYFDRLPPSDKGLVALMAARSGLTNNVQHYLEELHRPFSRQKRTSYQSWSIRQVLVYYRLIMDRHKDEEISRLLFWVISSPSQVGRLKAIAQDNRQSLSTIAMNEDILRQIDIPPEEADVLQQHLALIDNFVPESQFADVWNAIRSLASSPLDGQEINIQQREELESILGEFQEKTVAQALVEVDKYITFVEEDRPDQQLIVTTIDHAKSQAFDTVFLLGAHRLNMNNSSDRRRWYVSISRAYNRFFFLVDGQTDSCQEDGPLFSWFPSDLYDEQCWP